MVLWIIVHIKTYKTEFSKREVSITRYIKRKMKRVKGYYGCKFHMLPGAGALSLEMIICPLVTQIKGERTQTKQHPNKVKLLGVNKPKPIGFIDCTSWICRAACIFHLHWLERLGGGTLKTYTMYRGVGFLILSEQCSPQKALLLKVMMKEMVECRNMYTFNNPDLDPKSGKSVKRL